MTNREFKRGCKSNLCLSQFVRTVASLRRQHPAVPKFFSKERKMRFLQLDPRQTPEALATNNEILNAGQVLGIEVTVPKLAARCDLGNVDPQHTGGRSDTAAIEVAAVGAVDYRVYCDHDGGPRPSEWGTVTLVTVRPDLDSVGAMAALSLLAQGKDLSSARGRIAAIAEFDKFANGEWPGKRPLPTAENPWPEKGARKLAAIAASAEDFRKPLGERVAEMERWLLSGDEPEGYRPRVEAERVEMIHALENGDIKVAEVDDGRIAVVKSTHRAATMLG
jgi:hypothetical protein